MLSTLGIIAALLAGTFNGSTPQSADTVEVSSYRFFMTDGMTLVDGFVKIPFAILSPFRSAAATNVAMYRLALSVTDESGIELTATDWTGTVPQRLLGTHGASTVEHFSFAVPQGAYAMTVTVTDSASGISVRSPLSFEGYENSPFASDLVLTSSLRRTTGEGDQPAPGEIQKGSFFISGSPRPILQPAEANLFYYLELYPDEATVLTSVAKIISSAGEPLVQTPPSTLNLSERGGVAVRSLDLTGLPPGDYSMELEVSSPDTTLLRTASFSVADFGSPEPAAVVPADPFAFQNEQVLDSLHAPLIYLMRADERGIFQDLSVDGKRSYLRQFWESRDPTPGTPDNEVMARFYSAINIANNRYAEGGAAGIPGWRTDRGRIFLKYGVPDDFLDEAGSGVTKPYIVWKYSRGRPLKFIFLDMSGLGHYELVFTDDRSEQSRMDWESRFEESELERVKRF